MATAISGEQSSLINGLKRCLGCGPVGHWYFTPVVPRFVRQLRCGLCVCGDTDGPCLHRRQSLFAAKSKRRAGAQCLPSNFDATHVAKVRAPLANPADHVAIPGPRICFAGVIDARIDPGLIATAACDLQDLQSETINKYFNNLM